LGDSTCEGSVSQQDKRDVKISALGPLKDNERKDLNCAVKEYLLLAGYRLAAMTFIEEVCIIYILPFFPCTVVTCVRLPACDFPP
jgi:hypothetical protein